MSTMKIIVELTVDSNSQSLDAGKLSEIKRKVEKNLGTSKLGAYLHGLGVYLDAEVVKVKILDPYSDKIVYKTRQDKS